MLPARDFLNTARRISSKLRGRRQKRRRSCVRKGPCSLFFRRLAWEGQKEMRLLKNHFSLSVLRVSNYGGAQEGAHDDGSAIPNGIAVLLLPPRGSNSRGASAPADRSLRRFQLCAGSAEELL